MRGLQAFTTTDMVPERRGITELNTAMAAAVALLRKTASTCLQPISSFEHVQRIVSILNVNGKVRPQLPLPSLQNKLHVSLRWHWQLHWTNRWSMSLVIYSAVLSAGCD